MLLRKNPSQTPWELEIIIPIYLYTYACGFPQLLPLHFHTIERLIAQTLTTPFQSVKWGFGAAGELEIIIPIYLYTYACGFPQLLPLHFHTIERLIVQTLTTPFQSVKWGFGSVGKYWKNPGFGGYNWVDCGIRRARQHMVPRSLVGVGAWRA